MFKILSVLFLSLSLLPLSCGGGNNSSRVDEENGEYDAHEENTGGEIHIQKEALSKIELEISAVEMRAFGRRVTAPGRVIPDQNKEAIIGSLVGGRIYKVFVNQGDYVNKGDSLLELESLVIGEIKARYIETRAELEFAEASYQRLDTLFKQNVGSKRTLLEARASLDKARAQFKAADRKLHSIGITDKEAENELSEEFHQGALLSIAAPISGTVVERNVIIGQDVEAADNLMQIRDISQIWVDAQVYEKDLSAVSAGREILFTVPAWPDKIFRGEILFVNKALDPASRTVRVRSLLHNQGGLLLPEMYGDVIIISPGGNPVPAIPADAVLKSEENNFVFMPGISPLQFEKRAITAGRTENGWTEILSGLGEREKVVSRGAFELHAESQKGAFESGHAH